MRIGAFILIIGMVLFSIPALADDVDDSIKALHDKNWYVRMEAARSLGAAGDHRAVDPLIQTLQDSDKTVRVEAARSLGLIGNANAIEYLIRELQDSDSYNRWIIIQALEDICHENLMLILIGELENKDSSIRLAAAWFLGYKGDTIAIDSLVQALNDSNSSVRAEAAWALGAINDSRAIGPLAQATKDNNKDVRVAAEETLKKFGVEISKTNFEKLSIPLVQNTTGKALRGENRTLDEANNDYVYSLQTTRDGGYILAGVTMSYNAGPGNAWLIKVDANGNELWNRTFSKPNDDSVQPTSNSKYILASGTWSYRDWDAWLIKVDANGNELWNRTFGRPNDDYTYLVQPTREGGYILAGGTWDYRDWDAWMIRADVNGNELWNRTFSKPNDDSVQPTREGGYILAGGTWDYRDWDAWMIRADVNGNKLGNIFDKTFGRPNEANLVQPTSDRGYIMEWSSYRNNSDLDVILIRSGPSNNLLWNRSFGWANDDYAHSIQPTSDDGYLLAGVTLPHGARPGDTWLNKVNFVEYSYSVVQEV